MPTHDRLVDFFGLRLRLVVALVAVGTAGGLGGAAYLWLLDRTADLLGPEAWGGLAHLGILTAIGVAVVALIRVAGQPADVELIVDNIHVPTSRTDDDDAGDRPRLRSLIPVSLLCIGAGGTLGPEAPLVTTAGTLAHRAGHRLRLEEHDVRVLVLAGMASGFAVLFGAPFGSALFALEIPHRRGLEYHEALIPACIGAVLGFAFSTAAGRAGLDPIWEFPAVEHLVWVDLVWAIAAGVVGAAIGFAFVLVTGWTVRAMRRLPTAALPPVGGAALGLLALANPYVLTNGEFQVDRLTAGAAAGTLAAALLAKFGGAVIAVATGWRGGFIIPLFFMGLCAGLLLAPHLPGATEWAFVTGAMIAANVAVTKTPLGSTLVILEMSGMTVLPTALIAALASLVLTNRTAMFEAQRRRAPV